MSVARPAPLIEAFSPPAPAVFERCNPVGGEVVTRAAAFSVADAVRAADAAAAAFPAWSSTGPNERRDLLLRAAERIAQRRDAFVEAMIAETGTSDSWARVNVQGAIAILRESASLATQVTGEVIPSDRPGCLAMTLRVPVGVVFGMAPWNAPLLLGLRAIAMPLACGNTVVLKASEMCPGSHWMISETFRDAGAPAGVVNVVTHDVRTAPELVEALIAHPAVRRVNFTGSTRIGRVVGELAGRHLKPALLELGGKAPLVVLEDADIDQAVTAAAFGAFVNQGQICMTTDRIVVMETIADRFVQRLVDRAASLAAVELKQGHPVLGTLVDAAAAERVEALVEDAVRKGAVLLAAPTRSGAAVNPVVLDRVGPGMRVYDEESFGPIAAIVRVSDEDEAVRVANDTEYGLAGAVFGSDLSRTLRVARRLECGVCHVNGATVSSEAQLPFGGTKSSGFGRFGGSAAIAEFTDLRTLTVRTQPQDYPH